jgi:hypothetical protein
MASYASALFCQLFAQELRTPGRTLRARIVAVLGRLSPTLKGRELRIYTRSLYTTMTTESGALRRDWRQRVLEEHGA